MFLFSSYSVSDMCEFLYGDISLKHIKFCISQKGRIKTRFTLVKLEILLHSLF